MINAGLNHSLYAMLALQVSQCNQQFSLFVSAGSNRMSTVLDETVLEDRPEVDLAVLAASLRAERDPLVVLAFDIGTSGVRASLFNSRGDEIEGSQVSLTNEFSELATGADVDADALIEFAARAIDIAVARAESLVSR